MRKTADYHISILPDLIKGLSPKEGIIVDATLGGGGHSQIIWDQLMSGKLISIDKDDEAIKNAVNKFGLSIRDDSTFRKIENDKSWIVVKGSFGDLQEILTKVGENKMSMILADLGVSSHQIDSESRGFSFMQKGPLDMRMNKDQILTARDLVNGLNAKELEKIFREYGEERYSQAIANEIIRRRTQKPINNTNDIVEIINRLVGAKYESSKHPARRIFQALRIAVNDEFGELERLCEGIKRLSDENTKIILLTFHSLERNIVEKHFNDFEKILPDEDEIRKNSRSKSCIAYVIKNANK